ncbi:16S rRNA (adenine(1518)-N(6)/adenine(1519)-N(6))-dimethyltransferase RsmA [Trichlorobacter ammonificans]|uniref:Ribosomal RNA small subunit methyltransferase A n=1 Tax=Trichlorobacter ammonificans TaxID=2916410 RepID=A0ABM9D7D2_9BACT|nr:16S rRNA (adenine(1518)-N(6)/adenine(1519)-N(6))-dimethyltransferase RsmA [Trichlorobacter ammonificans]CAH2031140.1 Ribosomal RNA small subunit methyltransferase A [Trichlorobacter ammonificans]
MTVSYPRPRKALGQNFLTDGNIVAKILRAADIGPGDNVLEVGPGRGALTELLARKAGRVTAIEFDRDLAEILRQRFRDTPAVTIHEQDVLKVDFASLLGNERWKVVANLPYNISTPVLFRFLEERHCFSRLVLMLQKEVGERLAAPPDCGDYGIVTVLLGLWFEIRREFPVPPGCFYPVPRVDSVVVSLVPRPQPLAPVPDQQLFERVVRAAFAQRRKTLHNCLKAAGLADPATLARALEHCGIDGRRRGETLTIAEFAALATGLAAPAAP